MTKFDELMELIISRANINLREFNMDVGPYVRDVIPKEQFWKLYAFYGMTLHHPLNFSFKRSSLAGSYFLGSCEIDRSIIFNTDVRGDELKLKGDTIDAAGTQVTLQKDEKIYVKDSFLIQTLVHNNSHDPENVAEFGIRNTIAMHYANIHGAPMRGCFLGPFATVDLTTAHDCAVGDYSFVQVGDMAHEEIGPGKIWVRAGDVLEFEYQYPLDVLAKYVSCEKGKAPTGIFIDFIESKARDFRNLFGRVRTGKEVNIAEGAAISRYAVIKGDCHIDKNVLVSQRAYLENAHMGKGANAQENCYIINSRLEGNNVTAHGGKIINATMGEGCFVGFNSFLRGSESAPLTTGKKCVIMPHTIIDLEEPVTIPDNQYVWGYIRNQKDLETNSLSRDDLAAVNGDAAKGDMKFSGNGAALVDAFEHRIDHILEANGAYFTGDDGSGHAQQEMLIAYNLMEPYMDGELQGMYPTIRIKP